MSPSGRDVTLLAPGCQPWTENVKPAGQDVKPLALKVDINDASFSPNTRKWTFLAPQRAKVDMDFPSETWFWHS